MTWPMMSPGSIIGRKPLYRCRSDPQIAVDVIFTMQSRRLMISGSGTSRTDIFPGPIQHVAFIARLLLESRYRSTGNRKALGVGRRVLACAPSELHRARVGLRRVRAALFRRVGEHDLTSLHHLLEVPEVVRNLLAWLLAPQHRHLGAELAERRIVLERDPHFRTTVSRRLAE